MEKETEFLERFTSFTSDSARNKCRTINASATATKTAVYITSAVLHASATEIHGNCVRWNTNVYIKKEMIYFEHPNRSVHNLGRVTRLGYGNLRKLR